MSAEPVTPWRVTLSKMPCPDDLKTPKPRKIAFLIKLIGIGLEKQTKIVTLLLIFHWISMIIHVVTIVRASVGITSSGIRIIKDLVVVATHTALLSRRYSMQKIISQTTRSMSPVNKRKLVKLDSVLAFAVWLRVLYLFCLDLCVEITSWVQKPGLPFSLFSVDATTFRVTSISFIAMKLLQAHTYHSVVCLYAWVFYALYLHKIEESEKVMKSIANQKRCLVNTLIELERAHQWFESIFSLLLLLVTSHSYLASVNNVYWAIALSSGARNEWKLFEFVWMMVDVIIFVALVGLISCCQDKLSDRGSEICNFLCAEESLQSDRCNVLLADKIKTVYREPVTIWRIMYVSRQLILSMCSSLLALAVLILQIDNGSLKNSPQQ